MARFSFALTGVITDELLSGLLVKVKNETTGQFVASTDPEESQLHVIDNNDGAFFVDGLPSGLYSVYVNSDTNVQEELQNIPFLNEDIITHLNNLALHRQINDTGVSATATWSAAKIIAMLALKGDLSALNALASTVALKADGDHSHSGYLPASGVSGDLQISSGVLGFKPNFTIEEILSNNKGLNQNLERLQTAISTLASVAGSVGESPTNTNIFKTSRRIVFTNGHDSCASKSDHSNIVDVAPWVESGASYATKIKHYFYPKSGDRWLVVLISVKFTGSSGNFGDIKYSDSQKSVSRLIQPSDDYVTYGLLLNMASNSYYDPPEAKYDPDVRIPYEISMKVVGTGTLYLKDVEVLIQDGDSDINYISDPPPPI